MQLNVPWNELNEFVLNAHNKTNVFLLVFSLQSLKSLRWSETLRDPGGENPSLHEQFHQHKVKCVCVFVLIDYWTQGESKRKHDLSAVCLCSVVGSALTFRIRQNALNLSAEDVANKAGEWQAVHFDEMRRHLLINSHIHQHLLSLHCSCWEEFTRGRDRIENHPDRSGRSMPISHFYVL